MARIGLTVSSVLVGLLVAASCGGEADNNVTVQEAAQSLNESATGPSRIEEYYRAHPDEFETYQCDDGTEIRVDSEGWSTSSNRADHPNIWEIKESAPWNEDGVSITDILEAAC